jgi:response regulator of citrate/malate metabolism
VNIEKISKINQYILKHQTGTPENLASKLNISKSMLHRYVKYLKEDMRAPVLYSRLKRTYSYDGNGELTIDGWRKSK